MFCCNGCGKEFKVNENPAVFDREGWAYHYKCLKAKESRNKVPADLPEAGAKRSAYAQLSDVRAWLKVNADYPDKFFADQKVVSVEKLDDFLLKYISEHFR